MATRIHSTNQDEAQQQGHDDDNTADPELRECASTKFEAFEVDWNAWNAEATQSKGEAQGQWNRLLQIVLSKNDEELTALLTESDDPHGIFDSLMHLAEGFAEQAEFHRDAAEVFGNGEARLLIAMTRFAHNLDRDGNPLPPPPFDPAAWLAEADAAGYRPSAFRDAEGKVRVLYDVAEDDEGDLMTALADKGKHRAILRHLAEVGRVDG